MKAQYILKNQRKKINEFLTQNNGMMRWKGQIKTVGIKVSDEICKNSQLALQKHYIHLYSSTSPLVDAGYVPGWLAVFGLKSEKERCIDIYYREHVPEDSGECAGEWIQKNSDGKNQ